jgi:DNA polymerase-3 subunit epsilon
MILITDVETTGFYRSSLPPEHPSQPHIVQIAAKLCEPTGEDVLSFSTIVDPGVMISAEVAKIHGITSARAREFGVHPDVAMKMFMHLYERASLVVAHNAAFDMQVLRTALYRVMIFPDLLKKPQICTMVEATPIIKLPPTERMLAAGRTNFKSPKLSECIKRFFNEDLDGAHDAMVDVIACKRIYFHMKGLSNGKEDEARVG